MQTCSATPRAEFVLSVVRDNLSEINDIHVVGRCTLRIQLTQSLKATYAVQQATLTGRSQRHRMCHTDRVFSFLHFLPHRFFSVVFLPKQKEITRGQRFLPSDGRSTGTQKLQRRGQKLRTTCKSRLLDLVDWFWQTLLPLNINPDFKICLPIA
jgi:hypothetical protein